MTFEQSLWILEQRRRLLRLGAPAEVIARWQAYLGAVTDLPSGPERDAIAEKLDDLEEPIATPDRLRPGRLAVHDVYRSGADINVGEFPRSAIPSICVGDWLYVVDERMPDFMDIIDAIKKHGLGGAGEALMQRFPEARRRYEAKTRPR